MVSSSFSSAAGGATVNAARSFDRSSAMMARPASASSGESTSGGAARAAGATSAPVGARPRIGASRDARLDCIANRSAELFAAATCDVVEGAAGSVAVARGAAGVGGLKPATDDRAGFSGVGGWTPSRRTESTVEGSAIAASVGTPRPGRPRPCSSNSSVSTTRCSTTDASNANPTLRRSCRRSRLRHRVKVPMRNRRRRLRATFADRGRGAGVEGRAQCGVVSAASSGPLAARIIESHWTKRSRTPASACMNHAMRGAITRRILDRHQAHEKGQATTPLSDKQPIRELGTAMRRAALSFGRAPPMHRPGRG
jgi:hypothetical protein